MRKVIVLAVLSILFFSCNMSDREYELPSDYVFVREGGGVNIVVRKHRLVISKGAVNFSYNKKFIFFSVDTTNSYEPEKIQKKRLCYYIHNIEKDTFSKKPLSYDFIKKFNLENSIIDGNNILLKR